MSAPGDAGDDASLPFCSLLRYNLASFAGTNVVFRRTALDMVAGMCYGTVAEDVHTSDALHTMGWDSAYTRKDYPPDKDTSLLPGRPTDMRRTSSAGSDDAAMFTSAEVQDEYGNRFYLQTVSGVPVPCCVGSSPLSFAWCPPLCALQQGQGYNPPRIRTDSSASSADGDESTALVARGGIDTADLVDECKERDAGWLEDGDSKSAARDTPASKIMPSTGPLRPGDREIKHGMPWPHHYNQCNATAARLSGPVELSIGLAPESNRVSFAQRLRMSEGAFQLLLVKLGFIDPSIMVDSDWQQYHPKFGRHSRYYAMVRFRGSIATRPPCV